MENAKPEISDAGTPRSGPGRLLQQARQDLRLAPEDVAQILHLSAKQIIALERDDYQTLAGPTYIRGYLRSYAQLLGLSPEKVVEAYNGLTIVSRPITLPQSAPPPQITSSDHIVKAATAGVVVVLLALVYLWWQSSDQSPELTALTPAPEAAPAGPDVAPDVVEDVARATAPDSAAGKTAVTEPHAPAESAVAPPRNTAAPAATANGQLTVSGMTLNVAPAPAEPVTTRTRRAVEIPPGVPRARLILHAVEESWADIRDAHDNRLLYENVPAGRRVSIEGVAPFSVFLGNADGVRVEFNGQDYDVSQHKRGQVARFTLGEAAANN